MARPTSLAVAQFVVVASLATAAEAAAADVRFSIAGRQFPLAASGAVTEAWRGSPGLVECETASGAIDVCPGQTVGSNVAFGGGAPGESFTVTAELDGPVAFVPGSCVPTTGTCILVDAKHLSWTGTVGATGQEEALFDVVGEAGAGDELLCVEATFQFGTAAPQVLCACFLTDCSSIAAIPTLDPGGLALMVLALLAAALALRQGARFFPARRHGVGASNRGVTREDGES